MRFFHDSRCTFVALLILMLTGCTTHRMDLADLRLQPYTPARGAVIAQRPAPSPPVPIQADVPSRPATEPAIDVPDPVPVVEVAPPVAPEVPHPVAPEVAPPVAPEVVAGVGSRILRPGTRVDIRLRGIPDPESFSDQVDEIGEITLPHLGAVRVAGLAASQAERHIERTYIERHIFRSINVIITTEEEEYFVQGEVRRPGKYTVTRNLTLMQAISEAGGFTPFADRRRIRVMGEDGRVSEYNARTIGDSRTVDPPIQPKDVIDVPRSRW